MSRWKKKKRSGWTKKERSGHAEKKKKNIQFTWKKRKRKKENVQVTLKKTKKWEGIKVKLPQCSFPSLLFLSIWEEKFCGLREKIFSLLFHSPYFLLIPK